MSKVLIINVLLLLVISSCFKQDSPEVVSDYNPVGSDVDRLESCSRVNFNNGFLRKQNVQDLFSCTKWVQQFPSLSNAINEVDEVQWNNLMEPVSLAFFDNRERRDRVIRELRRLDDRGALESLGRVLTALNETNFYDAFNELFICAEDGDNEACRDRPTGIATKQKIMSLLGLLNRDKEFFYHLSQFFVKALEASQPEIEPLRDEIRKFYDTSSFVQLRIKFLNKLMTELNDGIAPETKSLLTHFFSYGVEEGQPFSYRWIQHPNQNEELFRNLVRYPLRKRPQITKDLMVVLSAVQEGLSCRPYSGNNYLNLNISNEMTSLLSAVSVFDHGRFIYFLLDKVSLLTSAEVFCEEVRRYSSSVPAFSEADSAYSTTHEVSFIELMNETSSFVAEPLHYDLMNFIVTISTLDTQEVTLYPLVMATSKPAVSLLEIMNLIDETSESYFDLMFRLMKRFDLQGHENLAEMAKLFKDPDFLTSLQALGGLWDFYTDEEKNFLFKIIDRHMDEGTDIVSLFEFYGVMMEELVDASDSFKQQWFVDERARENFYLSVKSFASVMSGQPVLADFQQFFSRDHIIEIIKVVTQGVSLTEQSRIGYNYNYRTYYTDASERRDYVLDFRRSDLAVNSALRCIQSMTELKKPFYEVIIQLPQDCKSLATQSAPLMTFSWLNEVAKQYEILFGAGSAQGLLSQDGILSPRMLNSTMANMKILDEVHPGGLENLFESFKRHLFEYRSEQQVGYYSLLEKTIRDAKNLMDVNKTHSQNFRNKLIFELTNLSNQRLTAFSKSLTSLLSSYAVSLDGDKLSPYSLSESRFRYSCQDFLNQNIGYQCPKNFVELVESLNEFIPYLSKSYDNKTTFLGNLATAAAAQKGFPIPLNSPRARPYRMTMRETLKMQYDLSDPQRAINQSLVEYTSSNEVTTRQPMTVLERIEVVIRDVKFRLNYLGVQYQNSVTQGDDYNDDVESRKKLMERCIKVPIVRCGKKMTDDQKRLATNALEAYDGLLDVNNGRGLDSDLRYGDYMKTLVSTVVASSAKEAQKVRLFPLGEDLLKLHNGIALAFVTEMAGFSHIGRWVHNRFSKNDKDFEDFLSSKDLAMIDNSFLYGIEKDDLSEEMKKIGESLNTKAGKMFVSDLVKWFFESSNEQIDLTEKILGRLFVISSLVGPEDVILGTESGEYSQFNNINSLSVFKVLNVVINNWDSIRENTPDDLDLRAGFAEFWDFTNFIYEQIHNETQDKKDVYRVVNELILALTYFADTNFANQESNKTYTGLDFTEDFLKSQSFYGTVNTLRDLNNYLNEMKANNSGWHKSVVTTLDNFQKDERSSLESLKDYLKNTSIKEFCDESGCQVNIHYDEPYRMLTTSLETSQGETKTNLRKTLETLFLEEYEKFEEIIQSTMNSLNVRVNQNESR